MVSPEDESLFIAPQTEKGNDEEFDDEIINEHNYDIDDVLESISKRLLDKKQSNRKKKRREEIF